MRTKGALEGVRFDTCVHLQILLQGTMAAHRVAQVSVLAGILVEVPLCTFASFRFLSGFSFAGCTSTVAVMLLVVALPALDPRRQCMAEPPEHAWLLPGLVPATGIVAVRARVRCWLFDRTASSGIACASVLGIRSTIACTEIMGTGLDRYSERIGCTALPHKSVHTRMPAALQLAVAGHSTFPSVRAGMAEPRLFTSALTWTYLATAVILICMTSIGYWYWGDGAHTLVTRDFDLHSPYTHLTIGGNFGVQTVVEGLVVLNVVTTLPLLVLSLQDIVHSFFTAEERSGHPHGAAPVRPSCVCADPWCWQ